MSENTSKSINELSRNHKLLVTIVKKGLASKVVKASRESGAKGGTILYGRGHGIYEKRTFLGFTINSDKEIVLTLAPIDKLDSIFTTVEEAADLSKPSQGIGFVIDVKRVAGIAHMLKFYK